MEMAGDIPGWALVLGVVVTGISSAVMGWILKRPGEEAAPRSSMMSGAALVSSAVVESLIAAIDRLTGSHEKKVDIQTRHAVAMERQAKTLEAILALQMERDKRDAEERNRHADREMLESALGDLKREISDQKHEIADLKRGKG